MEIYLVDISAVTLQSLKQFNYIAPTTCSYFKNKTSSTRINNSLSVKKKIKPQKNSTKTAMSSI